MKTFSVSTSSSVAGVWYHGYNDRVFLPSEWSSSKAEYTDGFHCTRNFDHAVHYTSMYTLAHYVGIIRLTTMKILDLCVFGNGWVDTADVFNSLDIPLPSGFIKTKDKCYTFGIVNKYSAYLRGLGFEGVLYALGWGDCICVFNTSKAKLIKLIEVKGQYAHLNDFGKSNVDRDFEYPLPEGIPVISQEHQNYI